MKLWWQQREGRGEGEHAVTVVAAQGDEAKAAEARWSGAVAALKN